MARKSSKVTYKITNPNRPKEVEELLKQIIIERLLSEIKD